LKVSGDEADEQSVTNWGKVNYSTHVVQQPQRLALWTCWHTSGWRRPTAGGGAQNVGRDNDGHEIAGHEMAWHKSAGYETISEAANIWGWI